VTKDYAKWVALVLALLGWAYTLGITTQEIRANTAHRGAKFHDGVRALTDANAERIRQLELGQAKIEVKLDRILIEVQRLDGR